MKNKASGEENSYQSQKNTNRNGDNDGQSGVEEGRNPLGVVDPYHKQGHSKANQISDQTSNKSQVPGNSALNIFFLYHKPFFPFFGLN